MGKELWLIECVKSGLWSYVLEISCWTMLHWWRRPAEVDSDHIETLIGNNQLYHVRDSRHTKNIQINKAIAENEKCVFYFNEKKTYRLFGQPNI